jgi:hypothetical protein
MRGAGKRTTARRLAVTLLAVAIAGGALGSALDADPTPARPPHTAPTSSLPVTPSTVLASSEASAAVNPCGSAGAAAIAGVDATVAHGIYLGELRSKEVSADLAHVIDSQALLSALEGTDAAAVHSAVHTIVYTPHWHIVRLRVLKAGHVLADVGGPDVIAPISGVLRRNGRVLGSYVMSVQDDLGYVKLVTRFIGVPVDVYREGSFVMGTLEPAPSQLSEGETVRAGGASYRAQLLSAKAFPSGALRIALLIPAPAANVAAASCAAVRLAAWGSVALHIAARLQPLQTHYQDLVDVLHGSTGAPAYVFSGSTRIAGGSVPARIPQHGMVKFDGRSWAVFSWEPLAHIRVYFLTPPT